MKRVVAAILLTAAIAIDTATAETWTCRAESKNAFGWGKNESEPQARFRALRECARRTSRYRACKIMHCKPS